MTAPQNARIALSEIPTRMEQLRVATTPTNQLADEPTPANVLILDAFDNTPTNVSLQGNTLNAASPDEIVIRQRGRRRFTLTWSPDKQPIQNPFQKTPTKLAASHMTLRSSPRKRLLLSDAPAVTKSPTKFALENSSRNAKTGSCLPEKKLKRDERPIAQTDPNTNLNVFLKGLSQCQLVTIIDNLVSRDKTLEGVIRAELPLPDISYMEDELLVCKRNIFKSLPTSRLCKKTDSTAYAKASIHLSSFKSAILKHTRKLHESSHWDALLDYVFLAWKYVRATPLWENDSHNSIRRQCFKALTCHCVTALKNGGNRLGAERLSTLEGSLKDWSKDYEEILCCINTLNKILLQSRTSI